MSLLKSLANALPETKALPMRIASDSYLAPNITALQPFGGGTVLYAPDTGQSYIDKGYKKNAIVFSIVAKCAKKFSQVPWYHYKIRPNERKTWQEYEMLTKEGLNTYNLKEARKMRRKALTEAIVDSPLSKRLAQPNRNQTKAQYLEQLYTYKLLTGEGNTWYSRGFDEQGNQVAQGKPLEMLVIPRANLQLVKGSDAWDIAGYEISIQGERHRTPKQNITMWIFNNPVAEIDGQGLTHLRGLSPLQAGLIQLQASNEGGERLVNMNKNQGAAGFAYNKGLAALNAEQTATARAQFDSIINSNHMNGKYAVLGGEWGVHQLGLSVDQLKILDQMENAAKWLCAIYDFPLGLFEGNQTYANKLEDKRNFVFDNIAPAAYGLRDEWNSELLPAYGLDRERDVVDCDITALPEMAQDLKTQIEAMQKPDWLTVDEKREACGYEALGTQEAKVVFVPAGLQPLANAAMPIDGDLEDL